MRKKPVFQPGTDIVLTLVAGLSGDSSAGALLKLVILEANVSHGESALTAVVKALLACLSVNGLNSYLRNFIPITLQWRV